MPFQVPQLPLAWLREAGFDKLCDPVLTLCSPLGLHHHVCQHHHTQVSRVHEQRPHWADCLADPHAPPALPHDGLHTAHHRPVGKGQPQALLPIPKGRGAATLTLQPLSALSSLGMSCHCTSQIPGPCAHTT